MKQFVLGIFLTSLFFTGHSTYSTQPKTETSSAKGPSADRVKYSSVWDEEDIVFGEEDEKAAKEENSMLVEAQRMAASAIEELRKNGRLEEVQKKMEKTLSSTSASKSTRMSITEESSEGEASSALSGKFAPPTRRGSAPKVDDGDNELDELD